MKVGFVAANTGTVHNYSKMESRRLMAAVGQNTGNLAFWYGAREILDGQISLVNWGSNPETVKEQVDVLCIPAANFLQPSSNLQLLADLVEKVDKPCVVIGLGAQSVVENKIPELRDDTIRFLEEVSKRTQHIGVRGAFTKQVCEHYGITNAEVMGCPSNFISDDLILGQHVEQLYARKIDKLIVHSSLPMERIKNTELQLVNLLKVFGGRYVFQRPGIVHDMITRGTEPTHESVQLAEYYFGKNSEEEFKRFLIDYCDIHFDMQQWICNAQRHSHAIGTRLHGSIISLHAGIPSICISHDTRTRELTEFMAVPSISSETFYEHSYCLDDVFRENSINGEYYDSRRREIAAQYFDLFKTMGLKPSAKLLALSN